MDENRKNANDLNYVLATRLAWRIVKDRLGDTDADPSNVTVTRRGVSFDISEEALVSHRILRDILDDLHEELDGLIDLDRKWECDPWVDGDHDDLEGYDPYRTIITIRSVSIC